MPKADMHPTPDTLSGRDEDDLLDVSDAMDELIRHLRALDLMVHGMHENGGAEQQDIAALLDQTDRAETRAQQIRQSIEDIRRREFEAEKAALDDPKPEARQ